MAERRTEQEVAEHLAELYAERFGGKDRGRFRISMKHMRILTGRKRIPARTIRRLGEEMYELGYVLIDLETYFVVLAIRTFASYRRVSDAWVASAVASGVANGNGSAEVA